MLGEAESKAWVDRWGAVLRPGDVDYSEWLDAPQDPNLMYITRAWNDAFGHFCWNHPHYSISSFHLLMGQLPNVRDVKIHRPSSGYIDPRFHVFYIAESGSGKGQGSGFTAKMAARLGIHYKSIGVITTNALVGAHNPEKDHRIEPGYLDHEGLAGLNKPVVHILELSEAKMIMAEKPAPEQEAIMDNLQKVMNVFGTQDNIVSKKIGLGEEIAFSSNVSMFMTTYPPKNLGDVIVDRGFIQRCLFSVRETNLDQREIDAKMRMTDRSKFDVYVRKLCLPIVEKFLKQADENAKHIKDIHCHPKAAQILATAESELYEIASRTPPHLWAKLGTFVTRFGDIQLKIAAHFAIIQGKSTIDLLHATFATRYIRDNFLAVIGWLERNLRPNSEFTYQYNHRATMIEKSFEALTAPGARFGAPSNTAKWVFRNALQGWLISRYACTEETAQRYIDEFIQYGELETKVHPEHGPCLRLPDEGRRWDYGKRGRPKKDSA